TQGQPITLTWGVTGATTITIDNGVGTVTNLQSIGKTPAATTNYTLTATNATGSVTKTITVTVTPATTTPTPNPTPTPAPGPVVDTTPPSTPVISGSAVGPNQIDVKWTASIDNVALLRYVLLKNNSVIAFLAPGTL